MKNLRIAIQRFLRRLLGAPGTVDVEYAVVKVQEDIRQAVATVSKVTQDRIASKSREWDAREAELNKLAGDMTLAIYDAVEKIMAEIAEAKRMVKPEGEQSDKK